MSAESQTSQLHFDPDIHPDDTAKAFNEFIQDFELRYNAKYPDPSKVSLEAAIQRWQFLNVDKKPGLADYEEIVEDLKSKDKVAKFLGLYSSRRLFADWKAALPDDEARKRSSWDNFVMKMQAYYKPTENPTLKNFQFRSISQGKAETFIAFCNRVEMEAGHCEFKCDSKDCTAQEVAVRDQIVIGTLSDEIREEALKKSWSLLTLRQEGMRMESASKGASQIAGDVNVNKVGKYSFRNTKGNSKQSQQVKKTDCFYCGATFERREIAVHSRQCPAKSGTCSKCNVVGHSAKVCKSEKPVKEVSAETSDDEGSVYNVNIFHLVSERDICAQVTNEDIGSTDSTRDVCAQSSIRDVCAQSSHRDGCAQSSDRDVRAQSSNRDICAQMPAARDICALSSSMEDDFKVQLIVNNCLDSVLADTGAKVSVCSQKQAQKWKLIDRMTPTKVKIKPYKSTAIPAIGESRCSVSFGSRSVPVVWHIIKENCQPVLAGIHAKALGIIKFQKNPSAFMPINMIQTDDKQKLQEILCQYPSCFDGIGKLRDYEVNLHIDQTCKPVAEPPRRIPYHLTERVEEAIEEMINNHVIEEHPQGEVAPWVSNIVIAPKDDGNIRITLDAKNLNKAIPASSFAIPRQEDIKAKLAGSKFFSKLDLKSAFWQLEIAPESRPYTVFHAGGKLYRYKRLVMGIKSAQAELNAALQPLFAHIPQAHIIHDDLIIATLTKEEHEIVIKLVMEAIQAAGLTLNLPKCLFGSNEIRFWGMIVGEDGVSPDPAKVEALNHVSPPRNKEELNSFLCMMQSNSDFIAEFSKKAAKLRELTKKAVKFRWEVEHQACFENLLQTFKKETLLRYFDANLQSFVFVDAHITGFGAILAQGTSIEDAKPVAVASRCTSKSEKHYPQIDLEGMSVDYGLRRFREYLVGSPLVVHVVTDHKPLVPIFNGKRKGSVRTQRIKLRHQDIPYSLEYRKGKLNQSDYLTRHAKPLSKLPVKEQKEPEELNSLLYALHSTPVIDHIGLASIATATSSDKVLQKVCKYVKSGQSWIPKSEIAAVQKFRQILPELTLTGNGILLKGDRIVLPESLHQNAIELAHRGAHPGQNGMERRLRYHFFFHNMFHKVEQFVKACDGCSRYVDKKTKEPISHHKVPDKCWNTVAVDLYGPMPSSNHIVVVHDLASRFPAAKLVRSTKADNVIPALADIYDAYGNPETQISDNGPPFNSKRMAEFANERDIALRHTAPYHPNANPAETCMKPIGKALKMCHYDKSSEKEALRNAIATYRQTPHVATGVPPAGMIFRDGMRSQFPRKKLTSEAIEVAKARDLNQKETNEADVNSSVYRKQAGFYVGDKVLVRDATRKSKFQPIYLQDIFEVIKFDEVAKQLVLQREGFTDTIVRHPDDVKRYYGKGNTKEAEHVTRHNADFDDESLSGEESDWSPFTGSVPKEVQQDAPRRSERQRVRNRRYDDFV